MPKKRNRKRESRTQLAYSFDEVIKVLEDSFIITLSKYFTRLTNQLVSKVKNLAIFTKAIQDVQPGAKEVVDLKNLLQRYYKKIGKETVKRVNQEIRELSGQRSMVKIPDINEGLRYRSEKLALDEIRIFRKGIREDIKAMPGTQKAKADLIRVVRKASNTFVNRNVKLVSRMESVTAANQQRIEAFKKSTIIKGVQFLAILDKRTTVICRSRHNMILKLTDPRLGNFTPPCHFGCRSLLSGVTIYEKLPYTSGQDLDKVPPKDFGKKVTGGVSGSGGNKDNERNNLREEINRLRQIKSSELAATPDNLKKLANWDLEKAEKVQLFIKPYENTNPEIKKLSNKVKTLYGKLNSAIFKNDDKKIRTAYDNFKGNLRELQINHKIILDNKNYELTPINKALKKSLKENDLGIDVFFRDKHLNKYFIGEVKTEILGKSYFLNPKNQGYKILEIASELEIPVIFFLDYKDKVIEDSLNKYYSLKNTKKLAEIKINKDFFKDYDYF